MTDTDKPKSFLDSIFDAADSALDGAEKVLKNDDPKDDVIDAEFRDVHEDTSDTRRKDWEQTWKTEIKWANVLAGKLGECHHAFVDSSLRAMCGDSFASTDIQNRAKLEPGKKRVCCTTCINMVSRHG